MSTEERIRAELSRLVDDLVHGRLAQLETDGRIGRLTAPDVARELEEYPGKLTVPAPEAYTELDMVEINGSQGKEFSLDFTLWVNGEPSDLTLSCDVTVLDSGDVKLEMDDVHVL